MTDAAKQNNLYWVSKLMLASRTTTGEPMQPTLCVECHITPLYWIPCLRCGTHLCSACSLRYIYCAGCRALSGEAGT